MIDLAALRKTVTAMRLRVATVRDRDAHNNAARRALTHVALPRTEAKAIEASHRAQAAVLTAKLGLMPRYPRRERREAERALAKAERRAARC